MRRTAPLSFFLYANTSCRVDRITVWAGGRCDRWVVACAESPEYLWLSSEDNGPALSDGSTSVEVMAAEALGRFGSEDDLAAALQVLVA